MKVPSKISSGQSSALLATTIAVIVIVVAIGAYFAVSSIPPAATTNSLTTSTPPATTTNSLTTSTTGAAENICTSIPCVQGKVTVGPLCPVEYVTTTVISGTTTSTYGCGTGTVTSISYSQYYLVFTPENGGAGSSMATSQSVYLNSTGYFALGLAAGSYNVTMPNCPWMGCSQVFPKTVTVLADQATSVNFTIDTGIR